MDTSDEDFLSHSTSWEYLPSKFSHTPQKKYGGTTLSLLTPNKIPLFKALIKTKLRISADDIHFVMVRDEVPAHNIGEESCKLQSSRTSTHKVPFDCDIYSLPIDALPLATLKSKTPPAVDTPPPLLRHRNRKDLRQRHSIQVPEETGMSLCTSRSSWIHNEASGRAGTLFEGNRALGGCKALLGEPRKTDKLGEKNNNGNMDKKHRTGAGISQSKPGSSAEKEPSRCYHFHDSSQISTQVELDKSGVDGIKVQEKQKRRGIPFLNLFRKIRYRKENRILQLSNSHIQPSSSVPVECRVVTARALPTPPGHLAAEESPVMGFRCVGMRMSPFPNETGDVPASLKKVKDCGWYWGPLTSEGAEDLLRGEPDGSFIVRDSSDARYIFSLTFKLNGLIRHVRIEHDHGNFSFGPLTRFKASTIVDFVEKAVAHSRSGRYLFFLHRQPILGPMRVQLLHPYSRFRHPRSLQHMCRFVILKSVRRDLLETLGLPKLLQDYLNAPQYYFESRND